MFSEFCPTSRGTWIPLVGLLVLALTARIVGETYYVRISGSDANPGTSPNTAWRSINKAAKSMVAGDVVYVGAGTYEEQITPKHAGSRDKPIRFIADTEGTNTGDAGYVTVSIDSGVPAFDVVTDHIEFGRFRIRSDGGGVRWANCQGGLLRECEIYDSDEPGITIRSASLAITESQIHSGLSCAVYCNQGSFTIRNCLMYGNGDPAVWASNLRAKSEIWNCTIADNTSDGVRLNGGMLAVKNSIIANNGGKGLHAEAGSIDHRFNLIYANQGGDYKGTRAELREISANPLFVDNYHLASGSPAIDAGVRIRRVGIDLEGKDRSEHDRWDLGAYEYRTRFPSDEQVKRHERVTDPPPTQMAIINGSISPIGEEVEPGWTLIGVDTYSMTATIQSHQSAQTRTLTVGDAKLTGIIDVSSRTPPPVVVESADLDQPEMPAPSEHSPPPAPPSAVDPAPEVLRGMDHMIELAKKFVGAYEPSGASKENSVGLLGPAVSQPSDGTVETNNDGDAQEEDLHSPTEQSLQQTATNQRELDESFPKDPAGPLAISLDESVEIEQVEPSDHQAKSDRPVDSKLAREQSDDAFLPLTFADVALGEQTILLVQGVPCLPLLQSDVSRKDQVLDQVMQFWESARPLSTSKEVERLLEVVMRHPARYEVRNALTDQCILTVTARTRDLFVQLYGDIQEPTEFYSLRGLAEWYRLLLSDTVKVLGLNMEPSSFATPFLKRISNEMRTVPVLNQVQRDDILSAEGPVIASWIDARQCDPTKAFMIMQNEVRHE